MEGSVVYKVRYPHNEKDTKFTIYDINYSAPIKAIKAGRIWEKKLYNIYKYLIKKGDIVIDAGAFMGTHTVPFSEFVGGEGLVYAFEPQPLAFGCLNNTIQQNNIKNVILSNNALWNNDKEILELGSNLSGDSTITKLKNKGWLATRMFRYKVTTTTIDKLALTRCDFIKIDVEKSEWKVLEGASETIQKFKPVIFFETFRTKQNLTLLFDWCEENEYTSTFLKGDDYLLTPNT